MVCERKRCVLGGNLQNCHYLGKLFVTGVIVAELDFESMSSMLSDRSANNPWFSSTGEWCWELKSEFELELIVDSLID